MSLSLPTSNGSLPGHKFALHDEVMKLLKLFLTATGIYLLFLIRGLHNNHYLDWSLDFQIGDCLEIMIFTIPVVYWSLKLFSSKPDYVKDAFWFALFLSLPYMLYDLIYLAGIKGQGPAYFKTFWFLTVFYFIVLIEVPLIGYLMKENDPRVLKKHSLMLLCAITAWLLNWWEGSSSDHYLRWSLNMKIVRLTNIVLVLLAITAVFLRAQSPRLENFKDAKFLSLYFSFIFMVFDFFYLGMAKGKGLSYITEYWFVTLIYPIMLIEMPLIGCFMQGRKFIKTGGIGG